MTAEFSNTEEIEYSLHAIAWERAHLIALNNMGHQPENTAQAMMANPGDKRFALLARRLAKPEEGKAICARELGISRQLAYRLTKELRQQGFQVP